MVKKGIKYDKIICYLFLIGFFAYPAVLRSRILPEMISPINIFYLLAELLFIYKYYQRIKKKKLIFIFIIFVLSVIQIASNLNIHSSSYTLCVFIDIILPLSIMLVDSFDFIDYRFGLKILRIYNIVVAIIVFTGVLNFFTSGLLSSTLWNYLSNGDNTNRLWTIYGHPLFNTYLIILYYILNYYNNKYGKRIIRDWLYIIITLLGGLFTASKIGIVLILVLFMVSNFVNIKMLFVEIIALIGSYSFGFFELIIDRLTHGSLTTGRIDAYVYLMKQSYFKPYKFFSGYGTGYAYNVYAHYLSWASAAFEFPFLSFLLEYGYLYTILFYILTTVSPIITLLRRKQWHLLFCLIVMELDMNSFNAITLASDYEFIYIISIMLILTISKNIDNNKKGQKV